MKKRGLIYISFFLTLGLMISACESDIQTANAEYDWEGSVPTVLGIDGPSSVLQTFSEWYSPSYYRAGSTWEWAVVDGGATIVTDSTKDSGHDIYVTFDDAGQVVLSCTETTGAGTSSAALNDTIVVNPFCPVSDFTGSWTGTETGDSEGTITVNLVAGATAGTYVVEATDGTPGFLSGVFLGWGETFQAGFGPEGDITIAIGENGTISLGLDYWGQTLPGPYDYWYHGAGNWDGCTASPSMSFSFNLDWSGDGSSNRASSITLTKD